MTHQELFNVVKQCCNKMNKENNFGVYSIDEFINSSGLARAAEYAAAFLWVNQIPEDSDTRDLRKQLLYMRDHGEFDLE